MSRHITQFFISDSATEHMKESYIKRRCGDLLYEALKHADGNEHYAVRINITTKMEPNREMYSVLVDVIDTPLAEATYV